MANAESKLKIIVEADDKTKKGLSGANKSLGILQKDVSGLTKALGASAIAATGLAVAFGVSAIRSYGEAQASLARVDTILNTMGETAKKNRQAILDASEAAVKLGFDDEAAAESITKFYQRTNDLNKALELNKFAMDLSRYKGIELADATQAVNGALAGNVRLLKELGVVVDDTVTPLEAIAEAQRVVAGQATAFSGTWNGMMLVLNETWSNFKDTIGQALVESLTPFVKEFNGWLTNKETRKAFNEWTVDFKSWAEVIIPTLIDTFKMWFGWAEKVYKIMLQVGDAAVRAVELTSKIGAIATGGSLLKSAKNLISAISGKASGGPVSGGTPYVVGEKGPELFVPSGNGSIIPNNKMGGGGITVNINGGYFLDQDVAEKIGDMIIGKLQMSNAI